MAHPPYGPSDPYGSYGQPDPYAQPYQQQPAVQHHYYPSAQPAVVGTNGLATASLVLGLVGFVFCGLTSIPAIICGHIAQSQIKRTGQEGHGQATAGLVLGYIVTALWIIYWVVIFGFYGFALWSISESGTSTY
ncbi:MULTISPECIES: DUF4190 domain-containing protein [Actinomadura]|uniref:DUF4190 domain-containing protein n=1 Tax=Actinomadura miaoliensis TaxID=430685 RepID=A0ABP7X320_9ACTN